MKRIRRNISPVLMAGLGIWFLVRRNASMEILAIIVMVLSALGIVLHVTDKESTKAGKAAHIGLNGLFIGGGAWLLGRLEKKGFRIADRPEKSGIWKWIQDAMDHGIED